MSPNTIAIMNANLPPVDAGLDIAQASLHLHLQSKSYDLPSTPSGHRRQGRQGRFVYQRVAYVAAARSKRSATARHSAVSGGASTTIKPAPASSHR